MKVTFLKMDASKTRLVFEDVAISCDSDIPCENMKVAGGKQSFDLTHTELSVDFAKDSSEGRLRKLPGSAGRRFALTLPQNTRTAYGVCTEDKKENGGK